MPKTVNKLTQAEEKIEKIIRSRFTEEQMCAYFLTKTIRSQYQFDDDFITSWYKEIFNSEPSHIKYARRELVKSYTEMESFFAGEPGK